jgi:hypothetical protein
MSYRKIYGEEIQQKVGSIKHCPSKANLVDGFYKMVPDPITKTKILTIDASGAMNKDLTNIPRNKENSDGGCYALIPKGELACDPTDHYMGIDYNIDGERHNICHKEPVQTYFSAMFDDPNTLTRFFKLLIGAIIILLVTTIFGCCYEFWLRYGNSINCLYYFSKECKNISEKLDGKVSLLDYLYPKSICVFPYQKAIKKTQSGGFKKNYIMKGGEVKEGFNSNSLEFKNVNGNNTKCITLEENIDESNNRRFPYNLADYVHDSDSYNIIKIPIKLFSFTFLYCVLFTRAFLNWTLSTLSTKYQNNVKSSATLSNIVFLLLCGLLIPSSPFAILGFILFIITAIMSISTIFSIILCINRDLLGSVFPFLKIDKCITNDDQVLKDYYDVFNSIKNNYFYSISKKDGIYSGAIVPCIILFIFAMISLSISINPDNESTNALNGFIIFCYWTFIGVAVSSLLLKLFSKYKDNIIIASLITFSKAVNDGFFNIFLLINLLFISVLGFFGLILGNMFANVYMTLSTLFNFFYIPITNPLEFFDIMKDHADLLTILFCIGVIGSVGFAFDRNTTGVMSGILVILILYKISKGLKAK